MKLTTIIAALSFSALVAATPVPLNNRRTLLPTPMQIVNTLFPDSGIPELAREVEKVLDCTYMVFLSWW